MVNRQVAGFSPQEIQEAEKRFKELQGNGLIVGTDEEFQKILIAFRTEDRQRRKQSGVAADLRGGSGLDPRYNDLLSSS